MWCQTLCDLTEHECDTVSKRIPSGLTQWPWCYDESRRSNQWSIRATYKQWTNHLVASFPKTFRLQLSGFSTGQALVGLSSLWSYRLELNWKKEELRLDLNLQSTQTKIGSMSLLYIRVFRRLPLNSKF